MARSVMGREEKSSSSAIIARRVYSGWGQSRVRYVASSTVEQCQAGFSDDRRVGRMLVDTPVRVPCAYTRGGPEGDG